MIGFLLYRCSVERKNKKAPVVLLFNQAPNGICFAARYFMKSILVTDDDPGLQDIYKIILERAGFRVNILSNGMDILNNHFEIPDLFLLDKQLSGVDGLELCRYLKNHPATEQVPVIIISASEGIGNLAKAAGADDYIEKPFDRKHLLDVIAENLGPA